MDNINLNGASEEVIELASIYAEKYVNYVENLPFDLQRNVTRLREIDQTCRDVISEIETLAASFTKDKDTTLKGRGALVQIQRLFGRCQELGDEKIAIVQQISETVDNRKKQVEHSAYRFKIAYRPDLKDEVNGKRELAKSDHKGAKRTRRRRNHGHEKQTDRSDRPVPMDTSPMSGSFPISRSHTAASSASKQSSAVPSGSSASESASKAKEDSKKDKDERSSSPSPSTTSITVVPASSLTSSKASNSTKATMSKVTLSSTRTVCVPTTTAPSSNGNGGNKTATKSKKKKRKTQKLHTDRSIGRSPSPQEIPIDPDEPTYCLCGQVSFGQMIGCDNKKCPIEWFHFSCVGLTHNPKGKWYCPDCARDMKERKKDGKHR